MTVRPAFGSRAHATAYATFSALCLTLPLLLAAVGRPTRRDVYRSLRPTSGAYAYIEREALDERSDIDMAFVGPSHILAGIDTVLVQSTLSAALGRPAVARTFGFACAGLDETYAVLLDVLDHRRVQTVVLMMPRTDDDSNEPHPMAYRVLDFLHHRDVLGGLPWYQRAQLYGDFVLGAPRHLLSLVRANPPDLVTPNAEHLGATSEARNLDGSAFTDLMVPSPGLAADAMIYSPASADRFALANKPMTTYQTFFATRILSLLARRGAGGVVIHLPMWSERRSLRVEERMAWPNIIGLPLVGVAGGVLFAGVSDDNLPKLYYDIGHMNRNGASLFTRTVLPALMVLRAAS